jgi:PEP-CTERM motif-containing protein
MRIRSLAVALAISSCALVSSSTRAAVVFSDNFDSYSNGNLSGQGGWTATASAATPMQVTGTTNKVVTLGTSGQDEYHALSGSVPLTPGNNIVTSATINVTSAQATGDYFLHLSDPAGTTTNFYQRLFIKSTTGGYLLGLTDISGTGSTTDYGTGVLATGTNHDVYVVWNFVSGNNNDTFQVYVDPTDTTTLSNNTPYVTHTWSSATAEPATLSAVNLRQGSASNAAALTVDNLSVSGLVPEPATLSLLSMGAVSLIRRRRHA